jgi:peptide-methionine (R)-S-oxide reductase
MVNKRTFLAVSGLSAMAAALASALRPTRAAPAAELYRVAFDEAGWHGRLTQQQFEVLRREGTERPFSSPLNAEHRKGLFACAGCESQLFDAATKFESGTGWPSFYAPLDNAIGTSRDTSLFMARTEVHCATCGGHLGHVFEDGPKPTGLRYCMNGVAMTFKAA